uniref:TNase-like domain-containing protein n=1 Tax=Anopheles funestus TaxID=62324 RepID=A0A182RE04_ANOFN
MATEQKFDTATSLWEQFSNFMRKDTKGVELVSYSVSGILLIMAYRKIRPFTIFGKSSDIPHHFIREQIKQFGRVSKIEPSQMYGPLLIVQHHPPAKVFFWSSKTIPIKIDGIDINANGYSWLQSVVDGKEVSFIPMKQSSSQVHAECRVYLKESTKHIDIGEALLSLGFAKLSVTVPKPTRNRKDVHAVALYQYYRTLDKAERYAKDRRNGLWQHSLPPRLWPLSLWTVLWDRAANANRLPALVR